MVHHGIGITSQFCIFFGEHECKVDNFSFGRWALLYVFFTSQPGNGQDTSIAPVFFLERRFSIVNTAYAIASGLTWRQYADTHVNLKDI